jgi:hypothetical protein
VVAGLATLVGSSKTQLVGLLPALAVGILWLPHEGLERRRPDPAAGDRRRRRDSRGRRLWAGIRRTPGWTAQRWPGALTCLVLLVAGATFLGTAPKRFNEVAAYDQVFLQILPHSPDPAADLRSLGVDPSLASSSGRNILDPGSAANRPEYLQFRARVTEAAIARFYATHPFDLLPVGFDGVGAVAHWRQDYLGTYTAGSGHAPGSRECRVCAYTALFAATRHVPLLVAVLWVLTFTVGLSVARSEAITGEERAVGRLAVILPLAAVVELWVVMLTEGRSDLFKHMIFTNLLTALCLPVLVAAWRARTAAARAPRGDPGSPVAGPGGTRLPSSTRW